jgi:hypothetical protein
VTVDHVLALVRPELHDGPYGLVLPDEGHVLRADLVVERRLAVTVKDLEVDQVNMDRVVPAARGVGELPDLDDLFQGVSGRMRSGSA